MVAEKTTRNFRGATFTPNPEVVYFVNCNIVVSWYGCYVLCLKAADWWHLTVIYSFWHTRSLNLELSRKWWFVVLQFFSGSWLLCQYAGCRQRTSRRQCCSFQNWATSVMQILVVTLHYICESCHKEKCSI